MDKKIAALLFASALALGACASTPSYGPAAGSGYGYSEQAIEANRHRITYRGKSAQEADDGALRRAAEITRLKGLDHFTIVSRDVESRRSGPRSSVGIGGSTGGRRSGIGLGVNVPLGGGREDVTVRIEIIMGSGERPENERSYDARSVLGNLNPS